MPFAGPVGTQRKGRGGEHEFVRISYRISGEISFRETSLDEVSSNSGFAEPRQGVWKVLFSRTVSGGKRTARQFDTTSHLRILTNLVSGV
jgi:hypothetical protein